MKTRTIVLTAAAAAIIGGLALAQTTMEGMDHSKMGGSDMGQMVMMSQASMIPPELADIAAA